MDPFCNGTDALVGVVEHVLRYLSSYTHRVAISNHRILGFDGERVTFRWKDYAHGGRQRKMTLTATEFMRRFFLHVLPKSFVRIRHYGLLSNRFRNQRLALARTLLAQQQGQDPLVRPLTSPVLTGTTVWHCPKCGAPMKVLRRLSAMEIDSS